MLIYIYIYPWCGALLAGAPFQGLRAGDAQPPPGPFRRGSAVTSATPSPPPATLAQSRSRRPGDEQGSHMNKNSSEFVGRTVRMTCTAHDLLHHQNKAHERQHKQHHYSFIIIRRICTCGAFYFDVSSGELQPAHGHARSLQSLL